MTFLVPLGLLVAAAVIGPFVAHLLRRRRPREVEFPPARLVPTAPPLARRRAYIEDRALLALRALLVLVLALLAASPLVRCSRLSLDRRGGASVALALVVDDSMSMNALLPTTARRGGADTRFELALVAARELAGSLRAGDAAVIVMAGAPPRLVLAPTGDRNAVQAALDQIAREGGSDAATDLDGALSLAAASLRDLPHPDRRIVLLSDLADGRGGASAPPLALADHARIALELPLETLRSPPPGGPGDCAVVAAALEGGTDAVRARVACALRGMAVGGRAVEVVTADRDHARLGVAAFPPSPPSAPATFDLVVAVDRGTRTGSLGAAAGAPMLLARIAGEGDALARDDVAPVLGASTAAAIGVVVGEGGALDEVVATGGAPVLERALAALQSGTLVRPLPSVPDRDVDLAPFAALAIDDPAGLVPEARAAIDKWLDEGGVLLLALGPHAASPPLGGGFHPLLLRPTRWEKISRPLGVDPARAGPLGEGVRAPIDLAPRGRTDLDREDVERLVVIAAWKDGAPLVATRAVGQGEAWLVTLPFAPDVSDLPLRPAFLSLLDAFVARVRDRGAGARVEVGRAWTAGPDDRFEAVPLDERGSPVVARAPRIERPTRAGDPQRARPRTLGAWRVTITPPNGRARVDVRAVAPIPREVDFTPREIAPSAVEGAKSGLQRTTTELAPTLAIAIAGLVLVELAARAWRLLSPRSDAAVDDAGTG